MSSLACALGGEKIFVRRIVTDSSLRIGSGRDDKEDALCVCVNVCVRARVFGKLPSQPVECNDGSTTLRACGGGARGGFRDGGWN